MINITGSYVQENKHNSRSNKYVPIQPSLIGEAMEYRGFKFASLKSGIARHEDKQNFQRTFARYRGPEISPGVYQDVIVDNKHIGRGSLKFYLGIYRRICSNGLITGKSFFESKVRHIGCPLEQLDKVIVAAMEQSTKLTRVVTKMKSIETSQAQREALIKAALNLLVPSTAKDIRHDLLHINRPSDTTPDLWTQFNLIQENAVKGRIVYRLVKTDSRGTKITDHAVRSIKPNTNRDVVFNQALFDVAASLVA